MCDTHNGAVENGTNTSDVLTSKVLEVFDVFRTMLENYKPHEIFLSFNGGKDCTVLLHLMNSYYKLNSVNGSIRVIYIRPNSPFQEIEDFVESCEKMYNIKIEKIQGGLKAILGSLCEQNPELKAVVMGSRRSDPFCGKLKTMQSTDLGWPPLMRVSPLLDWTCRNIWEYILRNNISYCKLYDEGYTSIGDKTNTLRNSHLKINDASTGEITYSPAYKLLDDNLERAGRS